VNGFRGGQSPLKTIVICDWLLAICYLKATQDGAVVCDRFSNNKSPIANLK
jgi:hypothetical protein